LRQLHDVGLMFTLVWSCLPTALLT